MIFIQDKNIKANLKIIGKTLAKKQAVVLYKLCVYTQGENNEHEIIMKFVFILSLDTCERVFILVHTCGGAFVFCGFVLL
jgi:hypothetical protein